VKVIIKNVFAILIILCIAVFVIFNIYWFYKLGSGLEITKLTQSDIAVTKQNIDLSLPKETDITSVRFCDNGRESSFYVIFHIQEEQKIDFIKSIEKTYTEDSGAFSSSTDEITIGGIKYDPISTFKSLKQSFTAIQCYSPISGQYYYQLIIDRPNSEIANYFREKFNIGWKNLFD